ncbi:MAG: hypothetical protein JXB42_02685 [Deltaproteobacteria bacterium]|nr:hypothetical protein [Deltaproteobacteria bacterium]
MAIEKYPLKQFRYLVCRVGQKSLVPRTRHWVGNDEIYTYYHEAVPRAEDPLYLNLSWKKSADASAETVGLYRINIEALLSRGFIRAEGADKIRLRICHLEDGLLYIQVKSGEPALAIGFLP